MGRVISMPGDPHQQVQTLLPWYMNGTLDVGEVAVVEAHLAECAECREDIALESLIGQDMAGVPLNVERGWAAMRSRIERPPEPDASAVAGERAKVVPLRKTWLQRSVPVRWALAAQAAAAVPVSYTHLDVYKRQGFWGSIGGMRHSRESLVSLGDMAAQASIVTYTRLDGSDVSMPVSSHLRRVGPGKIDRLWIFIDMAPLFAVAV